MTMLPTPSILSTGIEALAGGEGMPQAIRLLPYLFLSTLFAALPWTLEAGDPWQEKPYTEWTSADCRRILDDSPWARIIGVAVPLDLPPGTDQDSRDRWGAGARQVVDRSTGQVVDRGDAAGAGQPSSTGTGAGGIRPPPRGPAPGPPVRSGKAEPAFWVRWTSAATFRQAAARLQQLEGRMTPEQVDKYLAQAPAHHELVVTGSALGELDERQVAESCQLRLTPGDSSLVPLAVAKHQAAVIFHFPRHSRDHPTIPPHMKKAELKCKWKGGDVDVDFDLAKMQVRGIPDL